MPVIKFDNFGGEYPSVSPRNLPPGAAQTNRNLYALTGEFYPLKADSTVASCPSGTKTLHRFARTADGSFNQTFSSGWITSTADRSYVKGQINDERTERTYFTFDDGSARPRITDVNGSDRVLGVPRPAKPVVAAVVTDELTGEEAEVFLNDVVANKLRSAIADSILRVEPGFRFSGSTIYSGPYSANSLLFPTNGSVPSSRQSEYWNLYAQITNERATALGLDLNRLGATATATNTFVPITALPASAQIQAATFNAALASIVHPTTGAQFLTQASIDTLRNRVIEALDPNTHVRGKRDELDSLTKEFRSILVSSTAPTAAVAPVESSFTYLDTAYGVTRSLPTKPYGPEYEYSGEGAGTYRSQAWINYDAAVTAYQAAVTAYNAAASSVSTTSGSINDRVAELQARALAVTQEIESTLTNVVTQLTQATNAQVATFLASLGGASALGITTVERLLESRFYVVTFVTDWGEESQPSPVSDLLEIDQNDTVTVNRPQTSSGDTYAARNITQWRLYRSNTGSETSAFQFVAEVAIGNSSITDNTKAAALGETLPTTTWAEPPYRADNESSQYPKPVVGTNPYLRGLVGMPNGIMAGFFDNTVAFCEPYVPYAWPVEYQVTTEHPIVGLGVFGQTLFVGTTGNPYFISGADSASMSAQKLDSNQSCVSRRSIVSVQGGVLYASPDGLCLADSGGVRVVTSGHYTREDWQALTPSSMFAAEHESVYYLFYNNGTAGCLTFDLATKKLGRIDLTATAVYVDKLNDTMFVANGTNIQAVFGSATRRTAVWKSGRLVLPAQAGYAWTKVMGDQSQSAPATLRWYGDGALIQTLTITNTNPVRLAPGRYLEHEIELESQVKVTQVVMAGDTAELKSL